MNEAEKKSFIKVRFENLKETADRLRALADSPVAMQALAKALYQRATVILNLSKRLCPVDTGALRASGFVHMPDIEAEQASVTISYGGPAAPYAKIVHEDLYARHKVGQAKYLETAVTAEREALVAELVAATKQLIKNRAGKPSTSTLVPGTGEVVELQSGAHFYA